MKKWICAAVTLAIMALIFCLSAQPGGASYALSGRVSARVQQSSVAAAVTPAWFSGKNLNANLRKWAHIYLYCALGLSTAVTVSQFLRGQKKHRLALPAAAGFICLAYAASDEFHQLFVPDRAAQWQDVLIDAAGFTPCILLVWLLTAWAERRREKAGPHPQK